MTNIYHLSSRYFLKHFVRLLQIPVILKSTFNVSVLSVCLSVLTSSARVSSWVGGRAHSRQLDCPLLVLLLFRSGNPLHWSLASLLIWGTISPADGSLLKHRKRSELIPIAPVIPVISQLSYSLSLDIIPSFLIRNILLFFPKVKSTFRHESGNMSASFPTLLETQADYVTLTKAI